MNKLLLAAYLFLTPFFCFSEVYSRPAHVDQEIWDSVSPYFLPEGHAAKVVLDTIFHGKERVLLTQNTLRQGGFKDVIQGKYSGTIVASHRHLRGFKLKLYTDNQQGKIDWASLKDRVTGANSIRQTIENHNLGALIKVPKKWLYPLPAYPAPPPNLERKNFILIEEDMELIAEHKNLSKWKSSSLPKKLLDAVYIVLKENGLIDCAYAFNMPFSKDGRVAFVDTELHHHRNVPFEKLIPYLFPTRQKHWNQLIDKGGPH